MSNQISTITLTLPWWTDGYVNVCKLFARSFGVEPDYEKVSQFIVNHAKVELHPVEDQ